MLQTYAATCADGAYDMLGSRCAQDLKYSGMETNHIFGLEYQCKAETLLDLTIGSCRLVLIKIAWS